MKQLYCLLACLLMLTSIQAQNCLFFPFGISQSALKDSLANVSFMNIDKESRTRIRVNWEDRWMEYVFHEDKLYLIRSGGYIRKKQKAREVLSHIQAYFQRATHWVHREVHGPMDHQLITYRSDRWQQFFSQKGNGYTQVELCSYSLEHTPLSVRAEWMAHYTPPADPAQFQDLPKIMHTFADIGF